jgi:hypothetical protein
MSLFGNGFLNDGKNNLKHLLTADVCIQTSKNVSLLQPIKIPKNDANK